MWVTLLKKGHKTATASRYTKISSTLNCGNIFIRYILINFERENVDLLTTIVHDKIHMLNIVSNIQTSVYTFCLCWVHRYKCLSSQIFKIYVGSFIICDNQVTIYEPIQIPFAPHHCGFQSWQGLWILSCEEAIQLAYGASVVLLSCPFVPEIMQGRHMNSSSTGKAGMSPNDIYCVHVT
jgi:hypothetical protein